MKLYSYVCRSCHGEITHNVATRLLVEKTLLPLATRQDSKHDEGAEDISQEEKRALLLESLVQQAFGPVRSWLNKSKEKGQIEKGFFANMVTMLNRGDIECPKCKSRGKYKWKSLRYE